MREECRAQARRRTGAPPTWPASCRRHDGPKKCDVAGHDIANAAAMDIIARHMPSSRERLVAMKTPGVRWPARARRRNVTGRVSAPAALLAIILSLSGLAPACAELRIRASPGGDVKQYLALFARPRRLLHVK